jgi:hypothetical protein
MNLKKAVCLLAALAVTSLALSGCSPRPAEEQAERLPTLPPASVSWEAPDGDRISGGEGLWTLYLPAKNGMNLVARHVAAIPGILRTEMLEAVTRELLSYPANNEVDSLGGETELTLYGENPVEFSGGIVTVNLGSSALGLSYRAFYTLSLALAATLCEAEGVRCVNVLVAGRSVGLDTTGSLAMGSLIAHPGENLPVLWEQMEAKRTPVGQDAADAPLTSYMTLYYPLENGQGISCENRTLTFSGQTPRQMASAILEAMSHGAMYLTGVPDIPNLPDLLAYEPLPSELADGGRMITLTFREEAEKAWAEAGVDEGCLAAAICCSLTTFIPGLAGVVLRVGDHPLTAVSSDHFGEVPVLGGLLRRESFTPFLMGRTTVYYAREGLLVPVEKSVNRELADSPRTQLAALMDGPGARERAEGLEPTLPELVGEEDILGVALEGDLLLINLSESFRSEIQAWGRERETLLCYSMVNTLCENTGARKVCFFFEGEQVESIAGLIYWAGVFDVNNGLCEASYG